MKRHLHSLQCYQTKELREKLKGAGFEPLEYDAYSSVWFPDWDAVHAFFGAKEQEKLGGDGANFMDPDGFRVMAT